MAREVIKCKADFEVKLAANIKTDSKIFYSYANSKQHCRDTIGPLVRSDGNTTKDDHDTCNILNNFFSSVFTREHTDFIPDFESRTEDSIIDLVITNKDIIAALGKLKPNKSSGIDNLPSNFLINVSNSIVTPLCLLFNLSLQTGSVPSDWKYANVTPIFKKGSKCDPGNYRPISLTSHVCKIMETIIKSYMTNYLETNQLIDSDGK